MNTLKYFPFLLATFYGEPQIQYESETGLKGTYNETERVFKASFPRNDVKIAIDTLQLDPFMGLTSWAAFTPLDQNNFMVMGDLVLLQDEVNPVMTRLLNNNIEVTALHNHFIHDNPKVYFMHIGGKGTLAELGQGVRNALDTIKTVRSKHDRFADSTSPDPSAINSAPLENIFGINGQRKDGMVKFVFGRTVQMGRATLGKEMGVNTWAAFAGTNDNAIVDGDFAVLEHELQAVLKA